MKTEEKLNLTMLCDFYELTMGNGYFRAGLQDRITYFDVFFRNVPDNGGFAVCAGLEQLVQYIQNLHFDEEDIAFLRDKHLFSEDFLSYLRDFRFTGDIWAVPEGTPIFPREPVVTVRAPAIQAQLIETFTLLTINHQSLIATKANRIVRAAQGRTVLEFGSRRAQGTDGAISGARAAYIGGCAGTACTISDQLYGVPAGGTMAHSWVQMFDSQYEAFKTYCQIYPHNATLLVDTYNVLKSGVPDAIRAFDEVLKPLGIRKCGIRLDSGDMAYLTQEARRKLDAAGWSFPWQTVAQGIAKASFNGRMEVVHRQPLCLVDGAHNPDGVDSLCHTLDTLYRGRDVTVVMGMLADKDYAYGIRQVASRASRFIATTPVGTPRALPAEQAAQAARPYCAQVEVIEAPSQAAQRALELALEHQGMAIACGSLYMIGEAKQGFCSAAPLVD